jgi:Secretion system C-terminal sorting domain
MKQIISLLIIAGMISQAQTQSCLPDSTYRDSVAGVYPRPVSPSYPNAGINKKACINKFYDFTFTVVIPDSILIPPLTSPAPLDKAEIATSGAISNLPEGISYACNPPNCVFPKNTIGCLTLFGTPTNNNAPGQYKPVIKLTITAFGGFIKQTIDYPGPAFPGEYILELQSENNCTSANRDAFTYAAHWYPNPAQHSISNQQESIENITIFDNLGKEIYMLRSIQGELNINLEAGLYIIRWKSMGNNYAQKIIVR